MNSSESQFNKEVVPKNPNGVAVIADDEPDDAFAKLIMAKQLTKNGNPVRQLWVTGEGRKSKLALIKQQADALRLPPNSITFAQGALGKKDFPDEIMHAFTDLSASQGGDDATELENDATRSLQLFLESCSDPLLVVIKPFPELLSLPKELLAKSTVVIYGSFNFRSMFELVGKEKLAAFVNGAFKRVVLYETFFAIGPNNSISKQNAPRLFEIICQKAETDRYYRGLLKTMQIWNEHIFEAQIKSLSKTAIEMTKNYEAEKTAIERASTVGDCEAVYKKRKVLVDKSERSSKILSSIANSFSQQMVLADFGLAVLMFEVGAKALASGRLTRADVEFVESHDNTVLKPNENGKVYVIEGVDRDILVECLIESIQ